MKKAILLMAYGTPEKEEDILPYYTHIRHGKKPTDDELNDLKARYRLIGSKSPLFQITSSTAKKLVEQLRKKGKDVQVYIGMKHWHPYISETFEKISSDGVTDLLAIALAPHYSKMSIGSYQESVKQANSEHENKVRVSFVDSWHLDSVFIDRWRERILKACNDKFHSVKKNDIYFLFTAHSLPERILSWNDPYKNQLLETSNRLAKELDLAEGQYGFAFQSAGHTSEPWLGPDILEKIPEVKNNGWSQVLIVPIGFVSDHLEILYDIDIEARNLAQRLSIHLERTDSFNDSDDFIEVLLSVAKV